jgi:hypothetical protein
MSDPVPHQNSIRPIHRTDELGIGALKRISCDYRRKPASSCYAAPAQAHRLGCARPGALATGVAAGQSRPPPTTRHPSSRRPPATARTGRPPVLDCAAGRVDRLDQASGDRQTRHRDRLAPTSVSCLLATHLAAVRPSPHRRSAPGPHPPHGHRKSVGRAAHPRRALEARLSALRAHGSPAISGRRGPGDRLVCPGGPFSTITERCSWRWTSSPSPH